jgi:hypothetical protein
MGDFKRLDVWRSSQKLAADIYRLTSGFPSVERYGLSSQMRRAAVSVTTNIAEGCGRQGDVEAFVDVLTSTSSPRRPFLRPYNNAVWSSSLRGTLWQCRQRAW